MTQNDANRKPATAYKILRAHEWAMFQAEGVFAGSPVDLADGYIHLSTGEQLVETAARHFADEEGLVVLAIDLDAFGDLIRWEPSRGGALFPHLYGPMTRDRVFSARPL